MESNYLILFILVILFLFLSIFVYEKFREKGPTKYSLKSIQQDIDINFDRRENFKNFKKMDPKKYFDEFMASIKTGNKKISNLSGIIVKLTDFFDKIGDYLDDLDLEKELNNI